MPRYLLSELIEGKATSCENCKRTATIQDEGRLPLGWFGVLDSSLSVVLFCTPECVVHKLSGKTKKSQFGIVERSSIFKR